MRNLRIDLARKAALVLALICGAFSAPAETPLLSPCPLPNEPAKLLPIIWPFVNADHEGGVTLIELQVFMHDANAEFFTQIDTNHDGHLTDGELLTAMPLVQGPIMHTLDPNDDRLISYSEVSGRLTDGQFAERDKNHNGVLDCED